MSTACTTSRLAFDCRASSYSRGPRSISSPVSSSTPSTVLLNSSSSMTLANSSSAEQVADSQLAFSPLACTSKPPRPEVEGNVDDDDEELPENIASGSSDAKDPSNLNSSNEIHSKGYQVSKGEANGSLIETARADSDIKDVNSPPENASLGKPEDEGQTGDVKLDAKSLDGSQLAQLERDESRGNLANSQAKVVHKWSFKLDVHSSFVRNDAGCDDCELDLGDTMVGDTAVGHDHHAECSRL